MFVGGGVFACELLRNYFCETFGEFAFFQFVGVWSLFLQLGFCLKKKRWLEKSCHWRLLNGRINVV